MFNFSYTDNLVPPKTLESTARKLHSYIKKLRANAKLGKYDFDESSILLPHDDDLLSVVDDAIHEYDHYNLSTVIVIGIGGSNLGTWAIYDALKHVQASRKILFAETVDPIAIQEIIDEMSTVYENNKHVLVLLVTKSGITTETIANYGVITENLSRIDPHWKDRVVMITNDKTPLWKYAEDHNFGRINIPAKVGGRYSVLSAVGLLPLALSGINLESIQAGAMQAVELSMELDLINNPALASAASIYYHYKKNKNIHNTFTFIPQLATFGRWYRQLVGESLGKKHQGIVPLTSIGSTDLHSVGQLYFGGPIVEFTTFINLHHHDFDMSVPNNQNLNSLSENIESKHLTDVMDAIYKGVTSSYRKQKMPFCEIYLKNLDEDSLGFLMQMKMMETMFLGKLMGINAFNQPAVEEYKNETRQILAKN